MTRRALGLFLMALGVLGIALCALGVVYVWRAAADITVVADESLLLVADSVHEIDRSLGVASTTLDKASVAVDGLYTTTLDVSNTLSSTRVTMDEMAGLVEDDLPESIEASLVALDALEETAAVIDQLLVGLQLFGVGSYEPEVPLDEAVAAAGAGLEPVPQSLRAMGAGLRQTSTGLREVQVGILVMGDHMMGIREDAIEADSALADHRSTLEELQTRLRSARQSTGRPIQIAAWGVTLLMVWIGLSQLAIVRWGLSIWQRRSSQ